MHPNVFTFEAHSNNILIYPLTKTLLSEMSVSVEFVWQVHTRDEK